MSVDIYIGSNTGTKKKIEVEDSISIIRQVMDIFDISIRTVDYSKSIKIPKVAVNKEVFEGLGFTDSEFPYKRSYADVYVHGILLMKDAYVVIKESNNKSYDVSFISESKEIWKVVENDTLGDLNLDDTNHTKSAALIKQQWEAGITEATKYFYMYADYGGELPKDNKINSKYLIPSYRVPYLNSKIQTKYGATINIPVHLHDAFITFSDANEVEQTGEVVVHSQSGMMHKDEIERYIIEADGYYKLSVKGYSIYSFFVGGIIDVDFNLGGINLHYNQTDLQKEIDLSSGWVFLRRHTQLSVTTDKPNSRWFFSGELKITRQSLDISGNVSFRDFKIADFLKEIIYQSGAIPIKRKYENTYDFVTLSEMFSNDAEDWSRYFNEKEKEVYVLGKYAQNNWFRYKYEEKEDSNKDGLIKVENKNLNTNSDIVKSIFYNTPVNPTKVTLGGTEITTQQYQLWRRTTEQKNGAFVERYQPLSGRLFLINGIQKTTSSPFTIDHFGTTATTSSIVMADNSRFNFQYIINNHYLQFSRILQRAKVITATFKIPLVIFANFDFKRRIYVAQLGGYFIINRMEYKSKELMELELIEANYTVETESGTTPPTVGFSAVFEANSTTLIIVTAYDGDPMSENILMYGVDLTGKVIHMYVNNTFFPVTVSGNVLTFDYTAGYDMPFGINELLITEENGQFNTILTFNLRERFIRPDEPYNPYDPHLEQQY